MQTTQEILLVRPANFQYNFETAKTNRFQKSEFRYAHGLAAEAIAEFDVFAKKLMNKGIGVTVIQDTNDPAKPDAVFPNNWISFHEDGSVFLYPMCAEIRRQERRQDIIDRLRDDFMITNVMDLSGHEDEARFLEGTGSMVLDRKNRIAYACISPRTDRGVFEIACTHLGYVAHPFEAFDESGMAIYHTNVMMNIGEDFAVICLGSITDLQQRSAIVEKLKQTGHDIVDISFDQMNRFAGNMLALRTKDNKTVLAMSQSAYESLTDKQRLQLTQYCELLPLSVNAIESAGGGSVRCMIAEIFLPRLPQKN